MVQTASMTSREDLTPGPPVNPPQGDRHRHGLLLVLAALLCFVACSLAPADCVRRCRLFPCAAEAVSDVTAERSAYGDAMIYRISRGDCTIEWTVHDTEANRGVVKHQAQCPEPLARQLPLLTQICTAFFQRDKNAQAFRTLFWGGLEAERQPASQEMSLRLALAASKSPGWDVKKGKPKRGDLNGFVRDLANSEMIYPELKELFDRFDRSVRVASVEKVRVLSAGKLPFFEHLEQQGVSASDRLPFDCMTWFAVSPASPD